MKNTPTDSLIAALAANAKPVTPATSIALMWLTGLGIALAGSLVVVAGMGFRIDIQHQLAQPGFLLTITLLVASACTWGWATARLAAPRWPLANDVLASMAAGALAWGFMMVPDMLASDSHSLMETATDVSTHTCAMIVTFMTFPTTLVFLAAFRHAMPSSPRMMMAAATASGASFSMLAITMLCARNDAAHIVVGHIIPALLLTLAAVLVGRHYLRW
ncbi:MAG: hypothetical protein COY40_02170 [Alphaproteobacteria bacterium CG_4_10_14_0_8_um_filter_53_9]|nr:MAG: hypothetical protein COY40_02170 [Alphaproteobacteria bacterium CG_4_10_14_0_8_um_filter_53_9]